MSEANDYCAIILTKYSGVILWMRTTNERRLYNVTSSLIGWTHSQNDSSVLRHLYYNYNTKLLPYLLIGTHTDPEEHISLNFREDENIILVNRKNYILKFTNTLPKEQPCTHTRRNKHVINMFMLRQNDVRRNEYAFITLCVCWEWARHGVHVAAWWRRQMETFSASLAFCAGNSPVTGEFPTQRPVTWSFDVFFDLRLNKRLSKQSWGWWFETLSWSLYDVAVMW